jgi:DNA polymerase (family 10)
MRPCRISVHEKVLRLHKDLGIIFARRARTATKENRIRKAKGLGTALQTKILHKLAIAR